MGRRDGGIGMKRWPVVAGLVPVALMLLAACAETPDPNEFQPGDIFVAASVMNDEADDHAGTAQILRYDAELRPKGRLAVTGATHGLGGLAFGPDGMLWAFSQLTPAVLTFSPDGKQMPLRRFSDRSYSSIAFGAGGTLYFGEHLRGTATSSPFTTTRFKLFPGLDRIGDGHVFRHAADGQLLDEFPTQTDGGMAGFLGATSIVLADRGRRIIYVTETGDRVRHYDLMAHRQLPDLVRFGPDDAVQRTYVIAALPDSRLVVSTGQGFVLIDAADGRVLRSYDLPEPGGWATVSPSMQPGHVLAGNFMTGTLVIVRLADGEIVARAETGQARSLAGIAQYAGSERN